MDTVEWLATHKGHGETVKQLNEHQPPAGTYTIWTWICPCGARHVVSGGKAISTDKLSGEMITE